jgi:hypothetical protein
MGHSMGHDVPSDWGDKAADDPVFGLYKRCGLWTHDEAAILYNVARTLGPQQWIDIGCHTGWTTGHIAMAYPIPMNAGCGPLGKDWKHPFNYVSYIDPMLANYDFYKRFQDNFFQGPGRTPGSPDPYTSKYFFDNFSEGRLWGGVCIDGDHEPGAPLADARNAAAHLAPTGVIMLHDGVGRPVREAVEWLMDNGFKARAYFTPHLVFCCWRGDFTPPDHVPDPYVLAQHTDGRYEDFDFGRMS